MNKKEIKFVPASRDARIGCGLDFPGYGNGWSDAELSRNARHGLPGFPFREWDEGEGRYRYYVLEE
jgi:hypothetical protein